MLRIDRLLSIGVTAALVASCGSITRPDGDADAGVDGGAMVTLTITRSGPETGTVTSAPAGIDCGAACSVTVPNGTTLVLTASPDASASFGGWSGGGCTGTGACSVTLTANTTINAEFDKPRFLVTVQPGGNGTGGVTSVPAGIDCGASCAQRFDAGTSITLTAAAGSGSTFLGWTGAGCNGIGACTFTVSADTTVQASFSLDNSLVVTLAGTGHGTVTSSPAGIDCGATCAHQYAHGTAVTLTQSPSADSTFTGWSGACSGTGACTVTMDQSHQVTATYTLKQLTLTAQKSGAGSGTITSDVGGISCGSTCSGSIAYGTTVTLTATASTGSTFAGWSGGGCSGTGPCAITITAATTVSASFTLDQETLTVSKTGSGAGTVSSAPAGIACGATCQGGFAYGTNVTLTATAATGSTFSGWSGGGCSGTSTCTVAMTQAQNVSAAFTINQYTLTVAENGAGSGTVSSSPAGISCPGTCSASFTYNTSVTLTAVANGGSTFTGWSGGGCSGNGACTVAVTQTQTVTATFGQQTVGFTVSVGGVTGATGTITSSDGVFNCSGSCSHNYGYSATAITFTASPSGSFGKFLGWSGDCHGLGACSLAPTAAHNVHAQFGPAAVNYMFVTSMLMTPPLGPDAATALTNADNFCKARASAAGLGGTKWLAFLATSTGDGYGRLTSSGANGWVRTDGFPFADTAASMKPNTAKIFYPPRLDELGNDLGTDPTNYHVATGQFPLGVATGYTCKDWTSSSSADSAWTGSPPAGSYIWHSAQPVGCDRNVRLYCFEADGSATVTPAPFDPTSERIIWVSDQSLTPTAGGSVTNLDATCQVEAQNKGLSAPYTNYIALLPPSSTASAISRFDTSAGSSPFARIDGVVVASSAGLAGGVLSAPIQMSLTNDYQGTTPSVWANGTATPSVAGALDCDDWMSNAHTMFGGQGSMNTTEPSWWAGNGGMQYCDTKLRVICAHK